MKSCIQSRPDKWWRASLYNLHVCETTTNLIYIIRMQGDEECRSDLRFYKSYAYRLLEVLNIPEVLITYNQSKFVKTLYSAYNWNNFSIHADFFYLVLKFGGLFQNLPLCQMPFQVIFTIILVICYMILIRLSIMQEYIRKIHEKGEP